MGGKPGGKRAAISSRPFSRRSLTLIKITAPASEGILSIKGVLLFDDSELFRFLSD